MYIFGWVILIIFAILGLGVGLFLIMPSIISLFKTISYKAKKSIENKKLDIDAKAEQDKIRAKRLREAQSKLKDKKLEGKLNKIAKQLEIEEEKIQKAEKQEGPITEEDEPELQEILMQEEQNIEEVQNPK